MIYSYDIFDTLLYRKVLRAVDIFRIVEEKIRTSNLWKSEKKEFAQVRRETEFFLRRTSYREITIDQIYQTMVKKNYIDKKNADIIIKLELETEKEYSFLNLSMVCEIKQKMEENKRVVLISDMYWSGEKIREWLVSKDKVFEKIPIYVSCDYNASKSKGNLFFKVKKLENVQFDEWQHTGDNAWSDVKIPLKYGIHPRRIKESRKYEFERKLKNYSLNVAKIFGIVSQTRQKSESSAYELGASVSGPMIYEYVNWVLEKAMREKIGMLFFVLRDGYIPKIVADEIIRKRNLPIKTEFLFGSRVAWRRPSLTIDALRKLKVWDKSNWIFRDPAYAYVPFERLGFPKDELVKILGKEVADKELYSFSDFKKSLDIALGNPRFCRLLGKNIEESGNNLIAYFRQMLPQNEKFAFVDTNSTGKTQKDLNQLLSKKGIWKEPLRFFYHTYLSTEKLSSETQFVFLDAVEDDQRFPEALFRAPYNPCYGYCQSTEKVEPVFFNSAYCAWKGSFDYASYLNGILAFVEKFESLKTPLELSEYVDLLIKVVNFKIKSQDIVVQMAKIPFNPDMEGNEKKDFYPQLSVRELFHPFKKLIYFPKGSYYAAGGIWPLIYQMLKRLVKLKRRK